MGPGHSMFYESDAVFTGVNEGQEPVVTLVSNLRGEGQPARVPAGVPAG